MAYLASFHATRGSVVQRGCTDEKESAVPISPRPNGVERNVVSMEPRPVWRYSSAPIPEGGAYKKEEELSPLSPDHGKVGDLVASASSGVRTVPLV